MKLLLTSAGITNKTIAGALLDLVGKKAEDITVVFIPTAVNLDPNDKGWFIDNLTQLRQQNYKKIDIVDISALPLEVLLPRIQAADVLFLSGGVTPHLMYWLEKSGLKELLGDLLKDKVYVGISAGSIVASPSLHVSNKERRIAYKEKFGYEAEKGLGLVDFHVRSHFNSPVHPHASKEFLSKIAEEVPEPVYGLDDQMAIKIVDDKIELIGEGEYVVLNTPQQNKLD